MEILFIPMFSIGIILLFGGMIFGGLVTESRTKIGLTILFGFLLFAIGICGVGVISRQDYKKRDTTIRIEATIEHIYRVDSNTHILAFTADEKDEAVQVNTSYTSLFKVGDKIRVYQSGRIERVE